MNIDKNQKAIVYGLKKEKEKRYATCTISTYEGKDQNDNPKYSRFLARIVGTESLKKASGMVKDGQKIILRNAKVETWYNKEENKGGANVIIFDFDFPVEPKEKPADEWDI